MALGAIACAAIFMIVNAPPPAAKVVKREAPSRTLAYEQAIATPRDASDDETSGKAPLPAEEKPETKAKAKQPKPAKTPKVTDEAPVQEQAAVEPPEEPSEPEPSESEVMPWLRNDANTPPRMAGVPPGYDPYPSQPPMQQSHDNWAPPDEGAVNDGYDQGADQWGGRTQDQWGGENPDQWGNESYDQGYDQGYNNYDQAPPDQWDDQGNNQWANAPPDQGGYPPRDQWGNAAPRDQWGNPQQPQDQWGNQPGQYGQNPQQWSDQNTGTGEQWAQVVQSGAEMRAAAADDAPLLFAFPYGRNLRVVSRQGEWAEVTDPQSSASGWMKLQYLAPAGAPGQGYQQPQYDAYYEQPPPRRRGLFNGGFADMINRAFGGGD